MRNRWKIMGVLALVLALFMAPAPQALAAYDVKQAWVRVQGTAGETLSTGDIVAIKDADGEWYKADANDANLRPAVGIVGSKTGGDGETVEIILMGVVNGWTSLSEGQPVYLSETAGAATQSAPTYAQQIGVAVSTTAYFFNFQNYLDTSALTALGVLSGATPIILEGATADDYELTLSPEDPTADRTHTQPDYDGGLPLVIAQGSTQTSANNTTADVTGSSLTLADGWFGAGKTLRWTIHGTMTGANDRLTVILYIDDAAIVSLATTDASDASGDWTATFVLHEHTAYATQDAMGTLVAQAGTQVVTDYATDTTDFNDGGTTVVKVQIKTENAGDTATAEYVLIEHWNK